MEVLVGGGGEGGGGWAEGEGEGEGGEEGEGEEGEEEGGHEGRLRGLMKRFKLTEKEGRKAATDVERDWRLSRVRTVVEIE